MKIIEIFKKNAVLLTLILLSMASDSWAATQTQGWLWFLPSWPAAKASAKDIHPLTLQKSEQDVERQTIRFGGEDYILVGEHEEQIDLLSDTIGEGNDIEESSEESFSEETLIRLRAKDQQLKLTYYREIFNVLRDKKYDYTSELTKIHVEKDKYALIDFLHNAISKEHYFDVTKVCDKVQDFVQITLPENVIRLSEDKDGLTLQGYSDGQSLFVGNLKVEDIKRLQDTTKINGKALIALIEELLSGVTFKEIC